MKQRAKRPPPEPTWRSGATFPFGGDPPGPYRTVTDFEIALAAVGGVGIHMEWRSAELGLLTAFVYHHHLETPDIDFLDAAGQAERLRDGWRPVGTRDQPYLEFDQGFVLEAWEDERFVYVEHGHHEPVPTITTWYRVPLETFDAAWQGMLRRLAITG